MSGIHEKAPEGAPREAVLILGGGLTGGALALALASGGIPSVVIDAAPRARHFEEAFDGRASAAAAGSKRLLEVLGVWGGMAGEVQPIDDILVTEGRVSEGSFAHFLHFDHRETGRGPFGWLTENRHLRREIRRRLEEEPLITLVDETRVGDLTSGPAEAEALATDGRRWRGALAVICEGRGSSTAETAGFRYARWSYDQTGLVATIRHERPHEGVAHEYFLPSGPFAVLPLTGNRSSLVWTEKPEPARAVMAAGEDAFLREVRRRMGGMLGELELEGPRWSYPLSFSLAYDYVKPRLALLGDSAHAVHPIAGQGLNLGFRDVAALAEVLTEALRRGEDIGALDVLERYQRRRRFDNAAMGLGMDAMNRLFSNDSAILRAVRGFGLSAVEKLAPLKRRFMAQAAGEMGDLPRLLRGEPL
ncbi:FAD-dependent monooxygenase [Neomegalonema sp.]|uniref:FAD-dependent monooxygenase n=1 Tax=Neomegalonema sp. TaxID=2039713 RepID=UPI00261A3A6C|nr:FAD-dependent monooxygenase [Neomegalonema sp.]MDD2868996.1 FAD-dependent monooxygenase [Neomegalonema sp.]